MKKVPQALLPIPIPQPPQLPPPTYVAPGLPDGDLTVMSDEEATRLGLNGPNPETEAGRANLELQKRKCPCWWCAGGGTIPPQLADRVIRANGRLRPACRWHWDQADPGTETYDMKEGMRLILVEGVQES